MRGKEELITCDGRRVAIQFCSPSVRSTAPLLLSQENPFSDDWVHVHGNALVPQLCGGNRANGSDDDARQATNHVLPKIHLLGDLKQVPYLDGLGHEEDIDLAESNCVDGLAQWSRVFRQAPKDRTWQAA